MTTPTHTPVIGYGLNACLRSIIDLSVPLVSVIRIESSALLVNDDAIELYVQNTMLPDQVTPAIAVMIDLWSASRLIYNPKAEKFINRYGSWRVASREDVSRNAPNPKAMNLLAPGIIAKAKAAASSPQSLAA